MKKFFWLYLVMTFVYHSVVFELLMNRFSPLPSLLVWILALVLSWYVGNSFSNFSKCLYLIALSFSTAGVISYLLMTLYLYEAIKSAVQMVTLKMLTVSLVTIFTLSSLVALLGYMFREEQQ